MLSDLLQPLDSCFVEHQEVGAREPLVDRGFCETGLGPNVTRRVRAGSGQSFGSC